MASGNEMLRQVKLMMALRVVIVTSLFLPLTMLFFEEFAGDGRSASAFPVDLRFLAVLMTVIYGLTIVYALTLRYVKNMERFALVQILMDILIETAIVYDTGTITTPFLVLYLISVVSASVLLERRSALGVASMAVLAYLCLLNGIYWSILPFRSSMYANVASVPAREVFYTVFVVLTGFLATSVMTNYLAERTRRTTEALREVGLELTELQRFNERVIDSISGGLIVMTHEGRISFINAPGSAITGWSLAELRGRSIETLLRDSRELLAQLTDLEQKRVFRFERTLVARDGREVPIGASVTGLPATELDVAGPLVGLVLIFQDLTELKKLEAEIRLKDRLASVGEMASGIAHEIRNPLASMSGSVQLLRSELELTGDQKRLMDIVVDESRRLSRIIQDFLIYVRPPQPRFESVELGGIVEDTFTLLRNGEELKAGHELSIRRPPEGVWAMVDPGQLRQVFWNLALNALWSMPHGGSLVITLDGTGSKEVVVTVQDTGVGIPPERLASLFTPFSSSGRSGLGLSIVYGIVREHQGTISVDSAVGRGTTVTVRLPKTVELAQAS